MSDFEGQSPNQKDGLNPNIIAEFEKNMKAKQALEKAKEALQAKQIVVNTKRADEALERINQLEKNEHLIKTTRFDVASDEYIAKLKKENQEYMEAAKNSMTFLVEDFAAIVPFFRKNVILCAANTGDGKSTLVANLAYSIIKQKNPITGKPRKILIITNEEKAEDVINRITALIHGWAYTKHSQFTDEQRSTFDRYIDILAKNGSVTVIDDSYNGLTGLTTTIEGMKMLFDGLLAQEANYDAVLIDYYQNVDESQRNPAENPFTVQRNFAKELDQFKNKYSAPVVLLAQVRPLERDEKKQTPFKVRVEGSKAILNTATHAMEMVTDKANLRTEWVIWKSRFNEAVGQSIYTGYDRGRFVPYTQEFRLKVSKLKEQWEHEKLFKDRKEKLDEDQDGADS